MKRFFLFILSFILILSFCFIPVSAASTQPTLVVTSLTTSEGLSIPFSFSVSSLSFNSSDVPSKNLRIYFSLNDVNFEDNNGSFSFDIFCYNTSFLFSSTVSRFSLYGYVDSGYTSIGSVIVYPDRISFFVDSGLISSNISDFYFSCGITNLGTDDLITFDFKNINFSFDTSSSAHLYKYLGSFFAWSIQSISSILNFIISSPALLVSFAFIITLFVIYYYKRFERGGSF